jgi:hypothetical protein
VSSIIDLPAPVARGMGFSRWIVAPDRDPVAHAETVRDAARAVRCAVCGRPMVLFDEGVPHCADCARWATLVIMARLK